MNDDPLTPDDQQRFDALPREIAPAPALEDRVVAALRRDGAFGHSRRAFVAAGVAAAIVLVATGFALGRLVRDPATTLAEGRFMLLLYGADTTSPDERLARVAEYSAWAREEGRAGRLETGEELAPERIVLGVASAAPGLDQQPRGFFVIRAGTVEEASAIAARCPHLRHGGTVQVQRIAGR